MDETGHACARACMREVLIGSVREWGAQKQPSGQTSQHQSAPVTRARTIGANIAILPAFTFDTGKKIMTGNRRGSRARFGRQSRAESWKRSGPELYISRFRPGRISSTDVYTKQT